MTHLTDMPAPHVRLQAAARELARGGIVAVENAREWPYLGSENHDLWLMRKAEIQARFEEVLMSVYARSVTDLDSVRADSERMDTPRLAEFKAGLKRRLRVVPSTPEQVA